MALDKIRQRVGNAELRGIAAEATRQAMFIVIGLRTARVEEIYIKEKLKVAFLQHLVVSIHLLILWRSWWGRK